MPKKDIAIAVFYDSDWNIFVQERGDHSKCGEKYAYWGGGIEEGETPEQALFRELQEELKYQPEKVTFWKTYSFVIEDEGKYKDWKITISAFLIPVPDNFENFQVYEGNRVVKMPLAQAISEPGFLHKEDREILRELKSSSLIFNL